VAKFVAEGEDYDEGEREREGATPLFYKPTKVAYLVPQSWCVIVS